MEDTTGGGRKRANRKERKKTKGTRTMKEKKEERKLSPDRRVDLVEEGKEVLKGRTSIGIVNTAFLEDAGDARRDVVGDRKVLLATQQLCNLRSIETGIGLSLGEELPQENTIFIDITLER